jgi:ABC-type branched-subunit amino acid transport system substrate-binding protein
LSDTRPTAGAPRLTRRAGLLGAASGAAVLLAGCMPSGLGGGAGAPSAPAPEPASAPPVETPAAPPPAQTIGTGPVKVGLLLPLTGPGAAASLGPALRNAVELAALTSGASDVTFLIKDDASSAQGAKLAAQAALAEGAELLIGPVFAGSVKAAGAVARAANRPLIGFSSDATAAAPGVYLLSLLIESYVERVVAFAAARGLKSVAALAPDSDFGAVAMAALRTSAAAHGLRVMLEERYAPSARAAAMAKVAALGAQIDSLFLGEPPESAGAAAQAMAAAGLKPGQIQLLGVSQWSEPRVARLPQLAGAWFAAPDPAGFSGMAQRYRAKYGAEPPRLASLAYDAASLAAALARTQGQARYSVQALTAPTGFNGVDGVFRLRGDGLNERGLAVLRLEEGQARLIDAAPRSFAAPAVN